MKNNPEKVINGLNPKDTQDSISLGIENDVEKQKFFEMITKYKEKEKFYNEEKVQLNDLLQKLNAELEISKQKDKEDYLASLEKVNAEKVDEVTISPETVEEINEADSNVENLIKEIPNEEIKILEEAMKSSIPLPFESPKVKTDFKTYFKNQIVKLASGFEIPKSIKNIVERNTKKLLMTTAILTIWTSAGSFVKPENVSGEISSIKNKEVVDNTIKNIIEYGDMETYNQLSENGKKIYLYSLSNEKESYLIVDKQRAEIYIIGKDKKLIGSMPILLGMTKGEDINKFNIPDYLNYKKINKATTPAGKYKISKLGISEEDFTLYKGKLFRVSGTDMGIHITYPGELTERTNALNTETPDDNRKSGGCINIDENMWDKYIANNIVDRRTSLFILPDSPSMFLNPETGKVENINNNNKIIVDSNLLAMNNYIK